jgi:hypothetical protein
VNVVPSGSDKREAWKVAIGSSEDFEGASADGERPETITSSRLTTCQVVEGGRAVQLGFVDEAGKSSSVTFPFDQAESIVMTLPQMLSIALQLRTHNKQARYVFPLQRWSLESSGDDFLVANMMTNDGFQVSFAIPREVCKAIGWSLSQHGRPGLQERKGHGADEYVKLN